MIGNGALRIALTIFCAELSRPPGVSSRITNALAPPAWALAIASSIKSAAAGLIDPSISIRSIHRAGGGVGAESDWARARWAGDSITIAAHKTNHIARE
jgi:hypothetical protein